MQKKLEENIAQYTRIVAEGETVGYYCLESREGETELDDFYILPPFRGQGIGTSVLQKCLGEITQPVFLYVFRGNTGAIQLYNRMGFVRAEDVSKTRMIMRRDG